MGAKMDEEAVAEKTLIQRLRKVEIFLGVSMVLFLWGFTFYLVTEALRRGIPPVTTETNGLSDIAALTFGTAGVALAVFSLLVGGVAIAGWQQLKQSVQHEVEATIKDRIENIEKELRARVVGSVGMVLGLFYSRLDPDQKDAKPQTLREERLDYLGEAVFHCQTAYKIFQELPGNGKYMALNNFVYFAALQGEMSTRTFILEKARELRAFSAERNFLDGLLTYCQAVVAFSREPSELSEALDQALELKERRGLTDRQKREAATVAASLADKLLELKKKEGLAAGS